MSITLKRGLALVAATLVTVGAVAVFPTIVGADDHQSLTVTPSTITVGQSTEFIATGCADDYDPDEFRVVFFINGEYSGNVFTEDDGTAVISIGPFWPGEEGVYEIDALCFWNPENVLVFDYDDTTLTVLPPSLTVTPSTITVGQSAEFVATGCVGEEIETEYLWVMFYIDGEFYDLVPTEEGTATVSYGPAEDVGGYDIDATCYIVDGGEIIDSLFDYGPATLTVVDVPPPTTTTTGPAAVKSTLTFTG